MSRGGKRAGAGRPRTAQESEIIHIRVPVALATWIKSLGGSAAARAILLKHFETHKEI